MNKIIQMTNKHRGKSKKSLEMQVARLALTENSLNNLIMQLEYPAVTIEKIKEVLVSHITEISKVREEIDKYINYGKKI